MSAGDLLTEDVRSLEQLGLDDLRGEWARRYGTPPTLRSPELLRLTLAWRIQAEALGGLDATTRRRVRQARGAPARADYIAPGARIVREWRGVHHEVERRAAGYLWNGAMYRSLSAVAEAITGVKCNGPRFFGLREA